MMADVERHNIRILENMIILEQSKASNLGKASRHCQRVHKWTVSSRQLASFSCEVKYIKVYFI